MERQFELNCDRVELSIVLYLSPQARPQERERTIASLLAQTETHDPVWVIATEAEARACIGRLGDRARHWTIDPTLPPTQIYTQAIAQVETPWVALLEAGATWSATWIAQHRSAIAANPHWIAGWGTRQVTASGSSAGEILWSSASRQPIPEPLARDAIAPELRPAPINRALAECLVWNPLDTIAALVLRVEAWNHVGGLALEAGMPFEFRLWDLAVQLVQYGSVYTEAELGQSELGQPGIAPCCTYPYCHDPLVTPESIDRQLDRLFTERGDPYRRLRPRSRRNAFYWHGFHALQFGGLAHWLCALTRCDPEFSAHPEHAEAIAALVTRLERRCEDNWIDRLATLRDPKPTQTPDSTDSSATFHFLLAAIVLEPLPLVSVIIPIWNAAATIAETVRSVLAQTCSDFEILAIDDGSTDETLDQLTAINDDRLWVYSFPNAGAATSRNRGLKLAIGRYCSFLDADDGWTPDKLQAQYNALRQSQAWVSGGAKVAYSWVDYIDAAGDFLREGNHLTANGDVFAHLLLMNFLETGSNFLVETAVARAVGGSDTTLAHAEEWDFGLRLAWRSQVVCVPQVHVLYRLRADSKSSSVATTAACCERVLDRAFAHAPDPLQRLRPYSFANLYRYLAYRTLTPPWSPERCRQALDYLQRAIATDPVVFADTYRDLVRACLTHIHLPRDTAQRLCQDTAFDVAELFQATTSKPYPLVSVIIPVYNGATTIAETIASVQAQTLRDWEIVVIDDGSTDDTVAVVTAIGDPRIQIHRYPNAGQGESRNRGACHATGEFFAFLDADDLWLPHKLETMVKAIGANPKAAVAYSWIDHVDEGGRFLERGCDYTRRGYVYDKLLLSDFIAGGSNLMLWRGAFGMVGGFNPEFPPAEDRDMWLRLAEKFHFVAIEEPLLKYRQVPQSQSANVTRMERSQRRVIAAAFDRAPANFPFTELPELLPYYQRQVYANTYKYLTFKQLDPPVDRASARTALRLFQVVLDNEPQLWQSHRYYIIKLWLRIWLATWLSPRAMQWVFKRFRTFPRLHRDLLSLTRMSVRDQLPEDLRRRYGELTDG